MCKWSFHACLNFLNFYHMTALTMDPENIWCNSLNFPPLSSLECPNRGQPYILQQTLHPQAEAVSCQKRITTSDSYFWHVMLANTLHSSAVTLPLHRSPGGRNWSHRCNSSAHPLAPSIGNLPAQGSQWWAPSERARSHIQAAVEWSVSQGMSSSLCMQEGVQWGQNLWRKLAFPTIK